MIHRPTTSLNPSARPRFVKERGSIDTSGRCVPRYTHTCGRGVQKYTRFIHSALSPPYIATHITEFPGLFSLLVPFSIIHASRSPAFHLKPPLDDEDEVRQPLATTPRQCMNECLLRGLITFFDLVWLVCSRRHAFGIDSTIKCSCEHRCCAYLRNTMKVDVTFLSVC